LGPWRVLPGRLSVSRTFGDCMAKIEKYGGNSRVIVVDPEITKTQIQEYSHDFILIGSDGIFDKLNNQEIASEFWEEVRQSRSAL